MLVAHSTRGHRRALNPKRSGGRHHLHDRQQKAQQGKKGELRGAGQVNCRGHSKTCAAAGGYNLKQIKAATANS